MVILCQNDSVEKLLKLISLALETGIETVSKAFFIYCRKTDIPCPSVLQLV